MNKDRFDDEKILKSLTYVMEGLGLDLDDPNFEDTPKRVLKSYYEIFDGLFDLEERVKKLLSVTFPSSYKGMVIFDNIKCFSMCPHHLLPVEYTVHVGYIANEKMVGASKIPRLVKLLAKRPALQETFTDEIVKYVVKYLEPQGAIAVAHGSHHCMKMRGCEQQSIMTTSAIAGGFEDQAPREEFLSLVRDRK